MQIDNAVWAPDRRLTVWALTRAALPHWMWHHSYRLAQAVAEGCEVSGAVDWSEAIRVAWRTHDEAHLQRVLFILGAPAPRGLVRYVISNAAVCDYWRDVLAQDLVPIDVALRALMHCAAHNTRLQDALAREYCRLYAAHRLHWQQWGTIIAQAFLPAHCPDALADALEHVCFASGDSNEENQRAQILAELAMQILTPRARHALLRSLMRAHAATRRTLAWTYAVASGTSAPATIAYDEADLDHLPAFTLLGWTLRILANLFWQRTRLGLPTLLQTVTKHDALLDDIAHALAQRIGVPWKGLTAIEIWMRQVWRQLPDACAAIFRREPTIFFALADYLNDAALIEQMAIHATIWQVVSRGQWLLLKRIAHDRACALLSAALSADERRYLHLQRIAARVAQGMAERMAHAHVQNFWGDVAWSRICQEFVAEAAEAIGGFMCDDNALAETAWWLSEEPADAMPFQALATLTHQMFVLHSSPVQRSKNDADA